VIGLNCTSLIESSVVAKDRFHQVVKTALAKDGWNVTHDPLQIKVGGVDMEIDLGAERLLAAERGDEKIAVKVKSFLASASAISEFHTALGQFIRLIRKLGKPPLSGDSGCLCLSQCQRQHQG
jgi:hypothetical protein